MSAPETPTYTTVTKRVYDIYHHLEPKEALPQQLFVAPFSSEKRAGTYPGAKRQVELGDQQIIGHLALSDFGMLLRYDLYGEGDHLASLSTDFQKEYASELDAIAANIAESDEIEDLPADSRDGRLQYATVGLGATPDAIRSAGLYAKADTALNDAMRATEHLRTFDEYKAIRGKSAAERRQSPRFGNFITQMQKREVGVILGRLGMQYQGEPELTCSPQQLNSLLDVMDPYKLR